LLQARVLGRTRGLDAAGERSAGADPESSHDRKDYFPE